MKQVYMIDFLKDLRGMWEPYCDEYDYAGGNDVAVRWSLKKDEETSDFTKNLNKEIFTLGVPEDTDFVMLWISW